MEHNFQNSVRDFLQSTDVQFIESENIFWLPEHAFAIILEHAPESPVESALHYMSKSTLQSASQFNREHFSKHDLLYLYEDRWWHSQELMRGRILSRLNCFKSIFARKCKIVMGAQVQAVVQDFLEKYHSYGKAKSKYRYALLYENEVVAVASFSQPCPIPRNINGETVLFQSYEWIRYASLPNVRVVGGMGRLLQAFLKQMKQVQEQNQPLQPKNDIKQGIMPEQVSQHSSPFPIEVMSYSDNEWSAGSVYEKLGFSMVAERQAVEYFVNRTTYERLSERKLLKLYNNLSNIEFHTQKEKIESATLLPQSFLNHFYKIKNKGSRKFLRIGFNLK
ncbi:MAG: hypothetical protein RR555_07930 [Bacteroidales bacterium]